MLAGLSDAGKDEAWEEVEQALQQFENGQQFEGPCEMLIAFKISADIVTIPRMRLESTVEEGGTLRQRVPCSKNQADPFEQIPFGRDLQANHQERDR